MQKVGAESTHNSLCNLQSKPDDNRKNIRMHATKSFTCSDEWGLDVCLIAKRLNAGQGGQLFPGQDCEGK